MHFYNIYIKNETDRRHMTSAVLIFCIHPRYIYTKKLIIVYVWVIYLSVCYTYLKYITPVFWLQSRSILVRLLLMQSLCFGLWDCSFYRETSSKHREPPNRQCLLLNHQLTSNDTQSWPQDCSMLCYFCFGCCCQIPEEQWYKLVCQALWMFCFCIINIKLGKF